MLKNNIVLVVVAIATQLSFSQQQDVKGYTIDGDYIIFKFSRDDYEKVSFDNGRGQMAFDKLTIDNVSVAGEFNNWSRYRWKMSKLDMDTYILKKKLSDFKDEFTWEFKYVINNKYWAEPSKNTSNISQARKLGYRLNTYNLQFFTGAYPSEDGNVTFKLKGYKEAKKVILSGSFNKWNETEFKMKKSNNGWTLTLEIAPGDYEYRYIVDGNWMEDPQNPDRVFNEYGDFNSHINVGDLATFMLRGFQKADKVILAGSFNGWDESQLEMKKTDKGYWSYALPLSSGKHHYKFIVDGDWMVDPQNPVKEYDSEGNINSVYMIK